MKKIFRFIIILFFFYIISFLIVFEKSNTSYIFGSSDRRVYGMRGFFSSKFRSSKESNALLEKIYFIYYPLREKLSSRPVSLYGSWDPQFDEKNREQIRKVLPK